MGWYASAGLSRRVRSLESALCLVDSAASRIRYEALPLGELFQRISVANGDSSPNYAHNAGTRIINGDPPELAWRLAMENTDTGMNRGDIDIVIAFGGGLGKSDIEGQLVHCGKYREMLKLRIDEARAACSSKGKLFLTLGIAGGAALAILLI